MCTNRYYKILCVLKCHIIKSFYEYYLKCISHAFVPYVFNTTLKKDTINIFHRNTLCLNIKKLQNCFVEANVTQSNNKEHFIAEHFCNKVLKNKADKPTSNS